MYAFVSCELFFVPCMLLVRALCARDYISGAWAEAGAGAGLGALGRREGER